jgi:hypothetical protein
MSSVLSFEDFLKKDKNKPSIKIQENKKINESAFKVGDNITVKFTYDIPQSLISEFVEKVKNETGNIFKLKKEIFVIEQKMKDKILSIWES